MRLTFDSVVNSVVLVVCLILGASATLQLVDRVQRRSEPSGTAQSYRAGDLLPVLTDYSYADADATLILAVRSTCGFCTQSMPFYDRLVDQVKRAEGTVKIVAVSTDSADVLQQYFSSHEVTPEVLRTVAAGYLKIAGTPTIMLADPSGVVRDVWIGLLDPERETAVLSGVASVSKRSKS